MVFDGYKDHDIKYFPPPTNPDNYQPIQRADRSKTQTLSAAGIGGQPTAETVQRRHPDNGPVAEKGCQQGQEEPKDLHTQHRLHLSHFGTKD